MDPRGLFTQVLPVVGGIVQAEDEPAQTTGQTAHDERRDTPATDVAPRETTRPADRQSMRAIILDLLAANGGRMRQQDIVSATTVSKATVSRRLQGLEREGEISRYRLGRGKVVYLPGAGPENSRQFADGVPAED